jgi:mannose-6-phosphate isomerase-like protein (cupin superfamily)
MKISPDSAKPYVTKDESLIREIVHPAIQQGVNLSIAQATVGAGSTTVLHVHRTSQEVYHVTSGQGLMTLGREEFPVEPGDTVLIMPETPHCIRNTGDIPLVILCCCTPPYEHEDTEVVDKP